MLNWIRRILIKLSIQSRTKQELMPSLPVQFDCKNYRELVDLLKQIASESVLPAMTNTEAETVRNTLVNLIEGTYTWYEVELDNAQDAFVNSQGALERANLDFGDGE
jgi:hypothetical protein